MNTRHWLQPILQSAIEYGLCEHRAGSVRASEEDAALIETAMADGGWLYLRCSAEGNPPNRCTLGVTSKGGFKSMAEVSPRALYSVRLCQFAEQELQMLDQRFREANGMTRAPDDERASPLAKLREDVLASISTYQAAAGEYVGSLDVRRYVVPGDDGEPASIDYRFQITPDCYQPEADATKELPT